MNLDLGHLSAEEFMAILNSPFAEISYAQEGEDLLLARIFGARKTGFYVDVGAHHPFRFSNTAIFYLRGWRGINIDATPGSMEAFTKHRPEDINLEAYVSDDKSPVRFELFNEPALNTADPTRKKLFPPCYEMVGEVERQPIRLEAILDKYLSGDREIDFLSVDVEGADLAVIRSINFHRYRPHYIVTEDRTLKLTCLSANPLFQYMSGNGYGLHSKLSASAIWQRL